MMISVSHMLESVSNALNGFHGTDVLALCTGMRPVVMIDYGGKLPELQTRLLSLLELLQEVSLSTFSSSNITTWVSCFCSCYLCPLGFISFQISDGYMIYLINVRTLPNWLSSEPELFFVDLEQDPPQVVPLIKASVFVSVVGLISLLILSYPRW